MDRSKLGKKSRVKGHNLERQVVKNLIEIGYTGCLTSRNVDHVADGNKIDISDINNELQTNIQVKYTANCPNYFTIRDSCTDKSKPFTLIWKKATNTNEHSPGTVAIIPIDYFYKLLKLEKENNVETKKSERESTETRGEIKEV